ncbi:hypothetical protein TELCIR_00336 [Teladorsagia circumcincta]|uniref:Secreted protein n=1 Tax=Teladorsagia circumcincta TaxID=45464 RepID=A0A2G9V508_TELCI|nr:hypothetical protein TELCIR_00336 [Teladorsagia circumcincta]
MRMREAGTTIVILLMINAASSIKEERPKTFRPHAARVCSLAKRTANPITATANKLVLTCVEEPTLRATHACSLAKQAASPSTATANRFLNLRAALACSPARLAVNPTAAIVSKRALASAEEHICHVLLQFLAAAAQPATIHVVQGPVVVPDSV